MKVVLRQFLLFSLLFAMVFYSFRMAFAVLYYSFDNVAFAEKYCENKAKPLLKCNGKCQLAKLANENKTEQNETVNFSLKEIVLYFQSLTNTDFLIFLPQKSTIISKESSYRFALSPFLFRPPNVSFLIS